jgi:hypothetical protein
LIPIFRGQKLDKKIMPLQFVALKADHLPKTERDVSIIITLADHTLPPKLVIYVSHEVSKKSIVFFRQCQAHKLVQCQTLTFSRPQKKFFECEF